MNRTEQVITATTSENATVQYDIRDLDPTAGFELSWDGERLFAIDDDKIKAFKVYPCGKPPAEAVGNLSHLTGACNLTTSTASMTTSILFDSTSTQTVTTGESVSYASWTTSAFGSTSTQSVTALQSVSDTSTTTSTLFDATSTQTVTTRESESLTDGAPMPTVAGMFLLSAGFIHIASII